MNKRGDLKPMYGLIKEMYESGSEVIDIVCELGISRDSIYRALSQMGVKMRLSTRRKYEDETLVYAVNEPIVLEKVVIHGKWYVKDGVKQRVNHYYIDYTPLFSPR